MASMPQSSRYLLRTDEYEGRFHLDRPYCSVDINSLVEKGLSFSAIGLYSWLALKGEPATLADMQTASPDASEGLAAFEELLKAGLLACHE